MVACFTKTFLLLTFLHCLNFTIVVSENDHQTLKSNHNATESFDRQYFSIIIIYTVSGCISCFFLIITFLVYFLVPELNNLHGKIVISNVFSIFFFTASLLLVFNFTHLLSHLSCQIVGYSLYFFSMSMFFWMTIMSVDLCLTVIRANISRKGSAFPNFLVYSAVGWGSSAVLTLGIILADQVMEDQNEEEKFFFSKPNVGKQRCFLHVDAIGIFHHLPSMVLIIINIILFVITTTTHFRFNLKVQKAGESGPSSSSVGGKTSKTSKTNQYKQEHLLIYTKLFIVMGILWTFEFIHYFIHGDNRDFMCSSFFKYFLRIIDCINILRGCFIFFIFVCKASILNKAAKLTVLGVKLSFIKRGNIGSLDIISMDTETSGNRTETKPGNPADCLK